MKTTRTEKSAEGTPTPSAQKPAKGTPEPTPPSPRWDRMTHEFGEAMREYTLSKRVRAGGGTLKKENDESYQFRYKTLIGEGQFMEAPEHDCPFSLENWKDERDFECLRCKQTLTKPSTADDDSVKAWLCEKHYVFVCLKCTPVVLQTKLID